ncbi:MAG TPA: DUF3592 domain-containing protein, partial [Thermoanaerobaculia bacterium]|nr:DUF3592 domain-containing protein [Thermoanaerobaculia bacterium]
MSPTTLLLARWGFSLVFGITGLYLVSVAIRLIIRQRDWKLRSVGAEGTITGFAEETPTGDRSGYPLFAPYVTFTTANGESIEFKSSLSERPNPYTVGQKVAVRYLPEDPNGADLESVTSGWFALIVVLVMAAVALTIAALPFILPPPSP